MVVVEEPHVPLGVNRIVQSPVTNRRVGDADREELRIQLHRDDGTVTSVARAHDRDSFWIDVTLFAQVARCFRKVHRFVFAELFVNDLHERAAVIVGSAIVQPDDDVAFLREPLRPSARVPLVVDLLRSRSTVDVEDHRVSLVGIKRNRLEDDAVHVHGVRSCKRKNFRLRVGVRLQPGGNRGIRFQRAQLLTRRRPDLDLCRLTKR